MTDAETAPSNAWVAHFDFHFVALFVELDIDTNVGASQGGPN